MAMARKLPLTALIVVLAMVLGGAARMYRLADRSITADEAKFLGIPLNPASAAPDQPFDLTHVATTNLFHDTGPPGYPLMMFGVVRVFGGSFTAIRLTSVLFGVASIWLVYWLGLLIGQRTPGCIAASLLAFNGYHIARSQTANPYPLLCFLSLLATILLILLSQATRRRVLLEFSYGAVMLLGLASHHFFWALLATQIIWVLANAWVQHRRLPRLLNIQIVVMVLCSPLLGVARLQSLNGGAVLGPRFVVILREYVQFFWIIPGFDDIGAGRGIAGLFPLAVSLGLRVLLCLFCLWLLIVGFRQLYSVDDPTLSAPSKPFIGLWVLATLLATLIDIGLEVATRNEVASNPGPWVQTLRGVQVLAVLPSILVLGAITLSQSWQHLSAFARTLNPRVLAGSRRLVMLQTFLPLALLTIASLFLRPLLNARGLLFVAPYLLLMLACGIVAIGRRNRSLAVALILVIAVLHACSLWAYSNH
jgi:uncharacterized membrane protein